MNILLQDLRAALRSLRTSRGITAVILTTLTIGIATVTTIFSFVNSALYRPAPYQDADRMVALSEQRTRGRAGFSILSGESVRELRRVPSFERVGAYGTRTVKITDPTRVTYVNATIVDTALLPMLGLRPLRGRLPSATEIARLDPVVLISERLWHERFAASEAVLSETMVLDGRPHSIVGVAPEGFGFPERARLWLALSERELIAPADDEMYSAIGLLRPDATIEGARAEVDVIGRRLAATGIEHLRDVSLVVRDGIIDRGGPQIAILALTFLGAAICVLLIACTNVGNLMLVRAVERRTEMAVRASLGASRWRLIRQSFTESVVLSLAAGVFGLLLAFWSLPLILELIPHGEMPSWIRLGIDFRVLGFTFFVSLLTVVGFGLAPALAGSRLDPMSVLKSGNSAFSGGRRVMRTARRGVIIELALSVMLFSSAVLLWQTYRNLIAVDPGVDAERVLRAYVGYNGTAYDDIASRVRLIGDVDARLMTHPGIEAVATDGDYNGLLAAPGSAAPKSRAPGDALPDYRMYLPEAPDVFVGSRPAPRIWSSVVSDNYFRALGIPLLEGRSFAATDGPGAIPVAVVSEQLARALWKGGSALGRQFRIGKEDGTTFTVIGVARDVAFTTSDFQGMDAGPKRSVYYSARQVDGGFPDVLVRTRGDAELVAPAITEAFRAIDPEVSVTAPVTMAADAYEDTIATRVFGGLIGTFAVVGLLLAVIGIYGVLAYGVADRTREIGIRLALGGTARDVIALVVRDGMRFVGVGLVIGVALALAATPLLRRFVWGVSVSDPRILALVLVTFGIVALLACWMPARRATRVEPMVALRQD